MKLILIINFAWSIWNKSSKESLWTGEIFKCRQKTQFLLKFPFCVWRNDSFPNSLAEKRHSESLFSENVFLFVSKFCFFVVVVVCFHKSYTSHSKWLITFFFVCVYWVMSKNKYWNIFRFYLPFGTDTFEIVFFFSKVVECAFICELHYISF